MVKGSADSAWLDSRSIFCTIDARRDIAPRIDKWYCVFLLILIVLGNENPHAALFLCRFEKIVKERRTTPAGWQRTRCYPLRQWMRRDVWRPDAVSRITFSFSEYWLGFLKWKVRIHSGRFLDHFIRRNAKQAYSRLPYHIFSRYFVKIHNKS